MSIPAWKRYVNSLTNHDRYKILCAAVERLIEMDEVRFRMDDIGTDPNEENLEECLYWESCGIDLLQDSGDPA